MKTIKQSMLLLAASFAATVSFAQVGLGVANSTRATTKALNVNATSRVAANAATRTTNATKATVSTTTATVAQAKNTVRQNARINAQADVHASEQARLHANENAVLLGSQTEAGVTVDGASAADKVEQKAIETKDKVKAEKDATVKTTKKAKAKTETRVKAEAQAAEQASEKALEHANDHSAVFGATSETEAATDVKADRNNVSADGKVKTNTKAEGQVKKG